MPEDWIHVATHCWHRQRAEWLARERKQEEYARNLQEALGRDDRPSLGSEMNQIGDDSDPREDPDDDDQCSRAKEAMTFLILQAPGEHQCDFAWAGI